MPASASTSPFAASMTAAPPNVLPSAAAVASWRSGSIVVRTGSPCLRLGRDQLLALALADREQLAAGRAGQEVVEGQLEAARPGQRRPRGSRGPRAPRAAHPSARTISPVTMPPAPLVTRASAGPSASDRAVGGEDRLRARAAASCARARWPAVQAGEDEVGRPVDALLADGNRDLALDRPERGRVDGHRQGDDLLAVLVERPARLAGGDRIDGRRALRPPRRPPRAPPRRTSAAEPGLSSASIAS